MGSVKDLSIFKAAQEKKPGLGRFVFSDRYSVFDWGVMPDYIPYKGASLSIITAYFFEKLAEKGIKSHYKGIVENNKVKKLDELSSPSNEIEVDLLRVIKPGYNDGKYNYFAYQKNLANNLIPLEIIYRNTLPEHSSFRRRMDNGEIDINDYGLDKMPKTGVFLDTPIFDVSTKLEAFDRYISWNEAQKIAGLSRDELNEIINVLKKVNNLITEEVKKVGLQNLDGKIELAFDESRSLMVVDALGTPDECRFSYQGFSVSKEAIRKYYRSTEWYQLLKKKKDDGGKDWRDGLEEPKPLPEEMLDLVSQMYMACANEITGYEWFEGVLSLAEIKAGIEKIIK